MGVKNGLLLVDKPAGPTSHQIVSAVRRLAGTRKVGHGGTLDPMATGVLVVGIGKATKLLSYVSGDSKTYDATIRLGIATDSDDADGIPTRAQGALGLSRENIEAAIIPLTGEIMQVPSTVSAIKVAGRRAYDLAREGRDVQLEARPAVVNQFEILGPPRATAEPAGSRAVPVLDVDVRVDVSSGTYVRALARDLGDHLGVGAHLTTLRRMRVGQFHLNECTPLDTLEESPHLPIIGMEDAAKRMFPTITLDSGAATKFRHGTPPENDALTAVSHAPTTTTLAAPREGDVYAVFDHEDTLLGLVQVRTKRGGVDSENRGPGMEANKLGVAFELKTLNVFDSK